MGCIGGREKGPPEHTQKWAFITLSDFKATSAWTAMAYAWLWFMAIVALIVYGLDTFTAVNLLAFDKWSSQIQPYIPFKYSKWIFAACILLSWVLCIYEWIRAVRVIKRGGVAQSYMDPLAVSLQSMRPQGWGRFLVFTELTKSKKGADYVAFFVYFAFNGAFRVILAEGPRQVVNALTLYSVMQADLIVKGTSTKNSSSFDQFFLNLEALAEKNEEQAAILFSMLFTLVIWVFSALSLIVASILYLTFLWHYIPQRDGRLSIYCRRKIDRRLEKIVESKVKAGIEEEERKKQKAERKAELKRQKTGELPLPAKPTLARQPTLPQLGDTPELQKDEKMQDFGLVRQNTSTTVSTLPMYESRPPTRNGSQQRQPTLPEYAAERPGMPSRMGTQGSAWSSAPSYQSDAPLLSNAGYAGEGGRNSPAPPMPPPAAFSRQASDASFGRPMPVRTMTQGSQATQRAYTPMSRMDTVGSQQQPQQQQQRPFSPMSDDGSMYSRDTIGSLPQQRPFSPMSNQGSVNTRPPPAPRGPPMRSNTGFSFEDQPQSAISPMSQQDAYGRPTGSLARQGTQDTFRTAPVRQESQASSFGRPTPAMDKRPTYGSVQSQQSFSRPMAGQQRKPSQTSFHRLFSPPTAEQQPPPQSNSYEMTSQPSYSSMTSASASASADTGYVAFNPAMLSASSTPLPQLQQGPRRNITVAGDPGVAGNYFGQVREVPQRSATAPLDQRHTTGYADILDDYGASARSSIAPPVEDAQAIRRPEPPYGGPQRAHTNGPEAGWQYYDNNRF